MKYLLTALMITSFAWASSAQQNVQDQIDDAFIASFVEQESQFDDLFEGLLENRDAHYGEYWLAYAYYRAGVYHIATGQPEKGKELTAAGIAVLEDRAELDSEEHAMLATLIGFSIAFEPGKAMVLSGTSNKHFTKSLELNDQNMRAHLGIGRGDFYRPVEYGGGQVVEMHLQKALAMPKSLGDAADAPSWGRDEVFMFLAMYYQREGRKGEGILACKRGLKEFPGHNELNRLLSELEQS